MVIALDIAAQPKAALEDPEDVRRFNVKVTGGDDPARIAAGFVATGIGRFESLERALVRVDWVKRSAAGRVGPDWDRQFAGMLAYAAGKGWYDEAAGTIAAHTELA
jgi:hypothetical protein